MATITQYRPAYFSCFENKKEYFVTIEELLNIEFVRTFSRLPNGATNPTFYRYSIEKYSDHKGYEYVLMAEYREGLEWFIVGYINDNLIMNQLPVWTPKYQATR